MYGLGALTRSSSTVRTASFESRSNGATTYSSAGGSAPSDGPMGSKWTCPATMPRRTERYPPAACKSRQFTAAGRTLTSDCSVLPTPALPCMLASTLAPTSSAGSHYARLTLPTCSGTAPSSRVPPAPRLMLIVSVCPTRTVTRAPVRSHYSSRATRPL